MARPPLNDESFLLHVFAPKKNPQPTGIRHRTLKGSKTHKHARVNAFNRLTSVKQEIIHRSGLQDSYLRGDVTYLDTKRQLREKAVERQLVKPLRIRQHGHTQTIKIRPSLKAMLAIHVQTVVRQHAKPVNEQRSFVNMEEYPDEADEPLTEEMRNWSYGQVAYAGRVGSEYDYTDVNGHRRNPFWYH